MCGGCIIPAVKQENAEPHSPGYSAISFSFTSVSKQDKTAWFAWARWLSGPCEDENSSWVITQWLGLPQTHRNTRARLMHAISSAPNLGRRAIIWWQLPPGCCSSLAAPVAFFIFPRGLNEPLWLSKHNHTWSPQPSGFSFKFPLATTNKHGRD